jgi:putative ABC transport system permease protein
MTQAAIAAVIGYAIGMAISVFVVRGGSMGGAAIVLNWQTVVLMFFLTLGMCLCAGVVSVKQIMTLDPAIVFKA